jgi:DNA-binding NarL/FixJ family response regulator
MKIVGINSLSVIEMEILEHLQNGFSYTQTRTILHISAGSMKLYKDNIIRKLKLKNESALNSYISISQLDIYERYAI